MIILDGRKTSSDIKDEIAAAVNGYTHSKAPLTVMGDAAVTTHGTSSVEGNDKTKREIFYSNDVTAVAIAGAGY